MRLPGFKGGIGSRVTGSDKASADGDGSEGVPTNKQGAAETVPADVLDL